MDTLQRKPAAGTSITARAGIPKLVEDTPAFSQDLLKALNMVLGPK